MIKLLGYVITLIGVLTVGMALLVLIADDEPPQTWRATR